MNDDALFSVVTLSQSEHNLHKNFPNDIFCHLVILCLALLYQLGHVSILAVLHYNVDLLVLLIHNPKVILLCLILLFIVLNNVRVIQLTQNINLWNNLLLFPLSHFSIVQLLPNQDHPIFLPSNFVNLPETPYKGSTTSSNTISYFLKSFIILHTLNCEFTFKNLYLKNS